MSGRLGGGARGLLAALLLLSAMQAAAHEPGARTGRLADQGAAAAFRLITQDGTPLALGDLRGRVVVLDFFYTGCSDTCPLLTAKLVGIQKALGAAFGRDVYFLSITVDPQKDRPEVLRRYARALGCDLRGWAFLTGTPAQVQRVARAYGVYHGGKADGSVDHNLLTSLVDRGGALRVQYMGDQFDSAEFLHDIRMLAGKMGAP